MAEAIKHIQSAVGVPAAWTDTYTEADKRAVSEIVDWINAGQAHAPGYQHQRSQTKLAKMAKINQTTLNIIIAGKYPSAPTKWLEIAIDTIRRMGDRERDVRRTPFVETTVYQAVQAACHRAHLYKNFSVVSAFVGTGKTTAVKQYRDTHANVILVEADPDMNAGVLVNMLAELSNAVVHRSNKYSRGTKAEKMRAIIAALSGTDSLLILDEAETVTTQCLEYVRRISDKAGVGVVLSGTERLKPMIKDPHGRFGQISSRVSFWPPVIQGITERDAHAITEAAFELDEIDITDEIRNAFWQVCDGSARVLANSLIPGVRDYGLRQGKALTPELIFKVGQELLGFHRSARRA